MIEPKEYFHHCVAALRAAVSPDWVARTAIPLKEAFGSSYLQGRVMSLDPVEKIVKLEDGQNISFSHCVISVGSLGPDPARKSSPTQPLRHHSYHLYQRYIQQLSLVMLVRVDIEVNQSVRL